MSKPGALSANDKKTLTLAIAGAAVVAAMSYFGVVNPHLSDRTEDIAATERAVKAEALQSQQAEMLKAQAEQLDDLVTEVNRLTVQFPGAYEQRDWLAMIQEAASLSQVRIATITPDVPVDPALIDPVTGSSTAPPPAAAAVPGQSADPEAEPAAGPSAADDATATSFPIAQAGVAITANGSAEHLIDFLSRLGELERPILTDQVKLAGEGDELTLTLVGHTYLTRPAEVPEQLQDLY